MRDLSLAVRPGEVLALVGPNGSGKSTTLSALGRGMELRRGELLLDGIDVRGLAPRAFARRVARLPQSPAHPEGLTVEELVRCGRHAHVAFLHSPARDDRAAVREALQLLDLGALRSRRLETLSGGERRRAWLAMIVAQQSEILLLDEPTSALDLRHQGEILGLLDRIHRERGAAIVLVLHDLEQAATVADRMAVLHRGRLYQAGTPEQCLHPEMLRDVFGVAARVTRDGEGWQVRVLGAADPTRRL